MNMMWDVWLKGNYVGRIKAAWGLDQSPVNPDVQCVQCHLVMELVEEEGAKKVWKILH